MMTQTINDFKDFFRPKENPEEFNLKSVFDRTMGILKNAFAYYNIKVNIKVEDTKCLGYPNSLGHVLLNILNNAKDALIEREVKNKEISIIAKKVDKNVVIEIEDNAGGIDKDKIEKVFDPYFSTKLEKNGTGLGLYMSKMIMKHMNGKISVKNGEKGAIFRVEFDCS
jgi:signal transduction histidine kinase